MTDNHPEAIRVPIGDSVKTLKLSAAAVKIARLKHGRDDLTIATLADAGGSDVVPLLFWLGLLPDAPETTEVEAAIMLAQEDGAEDRVGEPLMRRYIAILETFREAQERVFEQYGTKADGDDSGKA